MWGTFSRTRKEYLKHWTSKYHKIRPTYICIRDVRLFVKNRWLLKGGTNNDRPWCKVCTKYLPDAYSKNEITLTRHLDSGHIWIGFGGSVNTVNTWKTRTKYLSKAKRLKTFISLPLKSRVSKVLNQYHFTLAMINYCTRLNNHFVVYNNVIIEFKQVVKENLQRSNLQ